MKIFGYSPGDSSVGISSCDFELDLGFEPDEEERDGIMEMVSKMMTEIHDNGIITAWFGDECPDCGMKLDDDKCTNPHCINNFEPEDDKNDKI